MNFMLMDRDGVINKDPGGWTKYDYVTAWRDFHFLPGSLEALKLLRKKDIRVIVLSNQAGVGRGYFTKRELDELTAKMKDAVNKYGGEIEDVYYCVHKPEDGCGCRKPKTGLFDKAEREHGIDLRNTYYVGDVSGDIIAGRAAGCRTIFVSSGKTPRAEMEKWGDKPDYVFDDLLGAVRWLVEKENRRSRRREERKREGKRR